MAATRMYWKDEMRKRAVFSKLTMSSWSGSMIGGMYLGWHPVSSGGESGAGRARTDHSWERTWKKVKACIPLVMTIWPMSDVRTFLEMRLAVGRLGWTRENASVRPTGITASVASRSRRKTDALVTAIGRIRNRSM